MPVSRIVVLGGTGFIGSNVASRLREDGHEIEVTEQKTLDLTNPEAVAEAAAHWDRATTIVFCAGIPRDRDASWHAARANILMAKHVAEAIPAGGWRGILFLSSSAVYGKPATLAHIHENTPLHPEDPYSFSKIESELLLAERSWSKNTPFLAMRPSIVFGPGDHGKSLAGRWASAIHRGMTVAVKGRGTAKIDLLPVEDLSDLAAAWVQKPFGGAVNAVSGQSLRVTEILGLIAETLGQKAELNLQSRAHEAEFDQIFDTTSLRTLFPKWIPRSIPPALQAYVRQLISATAS